MLLLCAGYLLLAATDRPSSNLAVLAGVFLALSALTRSSSLALAPLLLAPLFDRRHPLRANTHVALSALLGFGAALAPWMARHAFVFRELLVVDDGVGSVFWLRLFPDPRLWPRPAVLAAGAWFTVLFAAAIVGLARAPRRGAAAFCAAALAITMLLHVVLQTNWRRRTADWDPILLLYAAFGVVTLAARPDPVRATT